MRLELCVPNWHNSVHWKVATISLRVSVFSQTIQANKPEAPPAYKSHIVVISHFC